MSKLDPLSFYFMADIDPFAQNILGAQNLVGSGENKTRVDGSGDDVGELIDDLELPMSDEELITLKDEWERLHNGYYPKVKPRQDRNKVYYAGTQKASGLAVNSVVPSNLIFESEETFIPQALSKNPEPVVFSDDTPEGKQASNDIKTMLQYHADILCLRKKLGIMLRHWSIYFIGVLKHGWDEELKEIKTELRKPQNFILDPDGYVDEYGNYCGAFLGERLKKKASKLIELFPKFKTEIIIKCDGKLGTELTYTEWRTDEYCFYTFQDLVLDKHKNEFFNYDKTTKNSEEDQLVYGLPSETVTPGKNHFAIPKMPYTFLSVFSLQEHPHDITNLIEQNIANQDDINDEDAQVSRNLRTGNNSIALSGLSFNAETARQGIQALEDGDGILVPDGNMDSVKRIPASQLPPGLLQSLQVKKDTLRGVFGTQGITAQPNTEDETARGMILNQGHDVTRIGGGVGDALEQVADNVFNWWMQLYLKFYDEEHYGAIMGNGRAVEYVTLINTQIDRKFVISVAPNSMKPKDEISQQNLAVERWNNKAIDPIGFMKELNDPDPIESAKRLAMWNTNPQLYMMTYFPEVAPAPDSANPENPPDAGAQPPTPDETLSAPPTSSALSEVPINQGVAQPQI